MIFKIYNSLTRKIEHFQPINPPHVGLYTCGPTVYDYTHIGHARKYVNDDLLKRALVLLGYRVFHVQNITDVGHLVSDQDFGEDKLEKGARKTGKTVWQVARYFTRHFQITMKKLNILNPSIICRATDHIDDQIKLIKKILQKGYGYETAEAVYFNTVKFKKYPHLFKQKLEEKKIAARSEIQTGKYKKNPADFVLWFKRVGRFKNHIMYWQSPWGDGFPGWHIECSAMSMKYLGEAFDIHTGGQDHLSLHHPNEIAQSEAATGKPFVRYWIHHAFLKVNDQKMSKSLGNYYRLEDLEKKGFSPMALRYLYLTGHYRKELNFTFAALKSAEEAYQKLKQQIFQLQDQQKERQQLSEEKLAKIDIFRSRFFQAITNDLNIPQAVSLLWEVLKSNLPAGDKYDLILFFNEVFGLTFSKETIIIPAEIKKLAKARQAARLKGDFSTADKLRKQIAQKGYLIEDQQNTYLIKPTPKTTLSD